VHAFSGSLVTVVDIAGLKPALGTTPATVSIGADFTLAWTPGPGATDVMAVSLSDLAATNAGIISCRGNDSAGQIVVSKTLLAKFAAGDTGSVSMQRTSLDTVTIDNALIELTSNTLGGGAVKYGP
jgi:hypothetical protein